VVTNRKGTGGLDGVNQVYASEPDGLALGAVSSTKLVTNRVLDEPVALYNLDELSYLFNIGGRYVYFLVSPDGPYESVADLQAGEDLKLGGSSPAGDVSLGGMTVIELLDLDATVVTGIKNVADRALAVKRGEIGGYASTIASSSAHIQSGLVEPLFVLTTERDPLMPDVPAITELADVTGEDLDLLELWQTALMASGVFVGPPNMPEDRLAFLRGLAEEWFQDEEFREEISTVSGYREDAYLSGEVAANTMLDLAARMEEFRTILTEMIEKYRA
jgi:tripartite-type tricarboxylate transporter receptor subunit TctC